MLTHQMPESPYLTATIEYAVRPQDMAFMLMGANHHRQLEQSAKILDFVQAELPIYDTDINSIIDLLEPDELQPGKHKLIDYKCVGCYSLGKMLCAQPEYSGYDWQLNHYKLQAEHLGYSISRLLIQYIARDYSGKANGYSLYDKMGLINIPIYDSMLVKTYFDRRLAALSLALETHTMPEPCSQAERWGGIRCKYYCNVSAYCPDYKAANG